MKPLEALITGFVIFAILGVALAYSWDAGVWDRLEKTGFAVTTAYLVALVGACTCWVAANDPLNNP